LLKLGIKQGIETERVLLTALQGMDYTKANLEFLGYRIKEKSEEIKMGFKSDATNIKEFLEGGLTKTSRFEIAPEQTESLIEILNHIATAADIAKAAVFRQQIDQFPGKEMQETVQKQTQNNEAQWEQFLKVINDELGIYSNLPNWNPKINSFPTI
jgi:hypothetical protein